MCHTHVIWIDRWALKSNMADGGHFKFEAEKWGPNKETSKQVVQ